MNLETVSYEFGNGRLYFVGKKDVMWHIKEYFDRNEINNRACTIQKFIDIAINYNIHMGIESKTAHGKIITDYLIAKRRLDKHNLFISSDAYIEAMCFEPKCREKIKQILDLTDEEIAEIVRTSEWNKYI